MNLKLLFLSTPKEEEQNLHARCLVIVLSIYNIHKIIQFLKEQFNIVRNAYYLVGKKENDKMNIITLIYVRNAFVQFLS